MALIFNHHLIGDHGGNLCGEDRFSIEACECCQGHYLFNQELKDVYYDAQDLSRRFFKLPSIKLPPCCYCGAIDWSFASVQPDQTLAQAGPWGWTLKSRQFTFNNNGT